MKVRIVVVTAGIAGLVFWLVRRAQRARADAELWAEATDAVA